MLNVEFETVDVKSNDRQVLPGERYPEYLSLDPKLINSRPRTSVYDCC